MGKGATLNMVAREGPSEMISELRPEG